MKYIWYITYNVLFLPLFWVSTRILSIFNRKVKTGYRERKNLLLKLEVKLRSFKPDRKNILIHCSSLGEFEQAKPIIEELDKTSRYNFVVSFFSPSGYNHSKLDAGLQSEIVKTYLPFDWVHRISRFIDLIKPDAVVFIKYDLWFNFLNQLKKKYIYRIVANASYNEKSLKWKFFLSRSYKKTLYNFFNLVSTTDTEDLEYFKKVLSSDVKVESLGDTKYERVNKAKELARSKTPINGDILTNKSVFVIGSSWQEDDEILFPVLDRIYSNGVNVAHPLITIIAPHEPTVENIEQIEEDIREHYPHLKIIRYSQIDKYRKENVILIDCVGLLSTLYKYADFAYVGGGLQTGLHNVLEPAAYGIPVMFGDEKLNDDAEILIKTGGGIPVHNYKILYKNLVHLLSEEETRKNLGAKSSAVFIKENHTSRKLANLINLHFNNQ
jgi:3-deoxy-D-manno-octulosonic-acid transferase